MVSSTSRRLPLNIEQLATEAISQGVIKRRDHLKLTAVMLSSASLTPTERHNINQVFDLVRAGRVQLID